MSGSLAGLLLSLSDFTSLGVDGGAPAQQALFQLAGDGIGDHDEHQQQRDAGEDAGRVVGRGSLVDEQAKPLHRRSEEHTSELQSLMRISYAVFGLKKKHNNRSN